MDWEVSGLNPGGVEVFCTHKEKLIYTKDQELNCLACRSRAILPTFVGLCFFIANLITGKHKELYYFLNKLSDVDQSRTWINE